MSRYYVVAAIACALGLPVAGWFAHSAISGDFRTVALHDGRELVILRHVDQAYPVYGNTVKAELDLALDQKQKMIDASAGGKYESGIKQLYESLDSINGDVRTAVVAAYSGLVLRLSANGQASDVADAFKKWDDVLQLIVKESARVRSINKQLAAVTTQTSSGEWEALTALGHEARQGADDLQTLVKHQADRGGK